MSAPGVILAKTKKNGSLSERELIAWIRRRSQSDAASVLLGPGDDAALVAVSSTGLLFTIDTIAEGVDFRLDSASPCQVGRKAVAINLSDIAAMGGRPLFCVGSAVLRRAGGAEFAHGLYRGLKYMAGKFSCPLVGGDVTTWDDGVVVTVAMAGEPAGRRAITRSGARPGDVVYVTGTLGGSILGKHLKFTPRVAEAAWLAGNFPPRAMIDVSDGLGVDSAHLGRESAVALVIEGARIPVSAAARRLAARGRKSALKHALGDGEDFELLFTIAAARGRECRERWPFKTRLTAIGTVERGEGVRLVHPDGRKERIDTEGYEHS